VRTIKRVESEPPIYREEVTAILGALADINVNLFRVVELLEEHDGEEEDPEDDA
jgi:hypothetical protein